ncbi:Wdr1p [Paramyrothecium foliicola]|nr:Wdr1p [Paramyrothecium foliicola]
MDVHRCRFLPYPPSAINAIAFSHPKTRSAKQALLARLAIGRANGDIEIWNPSNGAWHQELVIRGGKDRSVDGLVWVNEADQDLGDGRVLLGKSRLFSIGYTSTVTEWDLETGKPKRHASGQHGDIWCIAAQPAASIDKAQANGAIQETQGSNKLIAGTIDGELVIYSLEDDDLRFQRVVVKSPTKRAQMVSITFQSRKVVIVGCSDSTVRAYDITKGTLLRRMTLGSDLVGGSKDIIVWSVKCLPNGDIVSGDSTGQVCIWDGKTYTQSQRLQSHKQDVLSLAVSADGTSIVSGGMDRRTVLHKKAPGTAHRWSKVVGRKYHDHDVKSMASFEQGRINVVVSGGPDAHLVVVPLKEMARENHRTISNLPQQPPLASAPRSRFLVSWWDREIHIWALRKSATSVLNDGVDEDINQNRKLLKTIVIKGDSNIASACINQEGTLLVVSTTTDVKAFRLQHQDPAKPSDVKMFSVEVPQRLKALGGTQVRLSPDGKWLCIVQEGSRVLVAKIGESQEADGGLEIADVQKLGRLSRNIPRYIRNGGLGSYDRNITQVTFAANSQMLATADLAGYVDTWVLRSPGESADASAVDDASSDQSDSSDEDEDPSLQASEIWVRNPAAKLLPKLPSAPAVLSFSDDVPALVDGDNEQGADDGSPGDGILLAITSSWNILAFHPRKGSLTRWSRLHPRKALPGPIQDLLDLAKGVVWQGLRIWVYGASFLFMLDLSQDLQETAHQANGELQTAQGVKRKRAGPTSGAGGKMAQGNLAPHQIQRHVAGEWEDVDMDDAPGVEDSSDEEAEDGQTDLARLRNADSSQGSGELVGGSGQGYKWWITYKYRPIFGMARLSSDDQPMEVAVVERPTWDLDLPESYYAGQPWER